MCLCAHLHVRLVALILSLDFLHLPYRVYTRRCVPCFVIQYTQYPLWYVWRYVWEWERAADVRECVFVCTLALSLCLTSPLCTERVKSTSHSSFSCLVSCSPLHCRQNINFMLCWLWSYCQWARALACEATWITLSTGRIDKGISRQNLQWRALAALWPNCQRFKPRELNQSVKLSLIPPPKINPINTVRDGM